MHYTWVGQWNVYFNCLNQKFQFQTLMKELKVFLYVWQSLNVKIIDVEKLNVYWILHQFKLVLLKTNTVFYDVSCKIIHYSIGASIEFQ